MKVVNYHLEPLTPLQADYLRYEITGKGDPRQAKNFNNVIGPVFFNEGKIVRVLCIYRHEIQVSPPGLHITLGVFY